MLGLMAAVTSPHWPPTLTLPNDPLSRLQEMLTLTSVPKHELLSVVREFYGDTLSDVICETSKLTEHWPERVTKRHIQILMIAMGHAITLEDLKSHGGEIDALCQKYRNPELFFKGVPSFWEDLQPHLATIPGPEKRSMALARQDYTVRQILLQGRPESPEFAFAMGEVLAKFAAYAKPETVREGILMPIYAEGRIVYYSLHKHLHKDGLHSYFYLPLHDKKLPAILLFRGTNGLKSAARSLGRGIGKEVFEKYAERLLKWVRHSNASSLRICGHSLGALDAMRMLAKIVRELVTLPETKLLQIKNINVEAYCSPKLDEETVSQWRVDRKEFKKLPQRPVIKLFRAEHQSDLVTKAGDFSLDYDEREDDPAMDTSLMLVSTSRMLPNPHQAHSLSFFSHGRFDPQGDRSFVVIKHRTLHRQVEELSDWQEVGEGVVIITKELIEHLARYFEALEAFNASQVGLRQRSRIVRLLSDYALDPTVAAVAVSAGFLRRFMWNTSS